jgi:hypothetical protein
MDSKTQNGDFLANGSKSSREIPVTCEDYIPKWKWIVSMFRKVTARALGAPKWNVSFLDTCFACPMDYVVSGLSNQLLPTEQSFPSLG